MSDLLATLSTFAGKNLYLYFRPEILDFTHPHNAEMVFCQSGQKDVKIPIPTNGRELVYFASQVKSALNDDGLAMMVWNLKPFASYIRKFTGIVFNVDRAVYDLKLLAGFASIPGFPENYDEAEAMLQRISETDTFSQNMKWYEEVYYPLAVDVIPAVETVGLVDGRINKVAHPFYELEGQSNGRLKCNKALRHCFNPHSIGAEDRANLRPAGHDLRFISLDYRALEVCVLQWLTNDPLLTQMVDSGVDLYSAIWEQVTGIACTPDFREICKESFLPVVFGMGAPKLAERLEVDMEIAKNIRDGIYSNFAVAMKWIQEQAWGAEVNGYALDYCGRKRIFTSEYYLARNFVIQSPASTYCLYKLIQLHRKLVGKVKVVFHTHDAYCLLAGERDALQVAEQAKQVLEVPSDFFPGLAMTCKVKLGESLSKLK
jgi:hypothetical protein